MPKSRKDIRPHLRLSEKSQINKNNAICIFSVESFALTPAGADMQQTA